MCLGPAVERTGWRYRSFVARDDAPAEMTGASVAPQLGSGPHPRFAHRSSTIRASTPAAIRCGHDAGLDDRSTSPATATPGLDRRPSTPVEICAENSSVCSDRRRFVQLECSLLDGGA